MNNNKDVAEKFSSIFEKVIDSRVKSLLNSSGVLVKRYGIVATVNSTDNTASVYLDGDSSNASTQYPNKTGATLTEGDKVYVFHQYNNEAQG